MSKTKGAALASVFLPLTKVDEEQRLVYGRITQEELDKAGEVMDYESSKPFFEKWSQGIEEASGGLSKGNVRVMHQAQVAGKLTEINFNDDEKAIDVCSKIVDDNEWQKVLEGCYTGFSVGGKYHKKWNEEVDGKKVKKYTAEPSEVSIVDNPCVGSATFMLTKADGTEQEIMFKSAASEQSEDETDESTVQSNYTPSNDELTKRAEELATAAADGSIWSDHLDAARDALIKEHGEANETEEDSSDEPAAEAATDEETGAETAEKVTPPGIKQGWTASDGSFFEKKADAEAHEETLTKTDDTEEGEENAAAKLRKALGDVAAAVTGAETARSADGPDEDGEGDKEFAISDFDRVSKAVAFIEEQANDTLQKSMWTVSRFADLLASIASLTVSVESCAADDSAVPEDMKQAVATFCASFTAFAAEEVARLLANLKQDQVEVFCCAENPTDLEKDVIALIELTKDATAAERERLEKLSTVETPESDEEADEGEDLQKVVAERDDLKKVVEEALPQLADFRERLQKLEDTPLPRAPRNVVEKNGAKENLAKEEKDAALAELAKILAEPGGADKLATLAIKLSQQNGQHLTLADR